MLRTVQYKLLVSPMHILNKENHILIFAIGVYAKDLFPVNVQLLYRIKREEIALKDVSIQNFVNLTIILSPKRMFQRNIYVYVLQLNNTCNIM